jgi:hypothetical protein
MADVLTCHPPNHLSWAVSIKIATVKDPDIRKSLWRGPDKKEVLPNRCRAVQSAELSDTGPGGRCQFEADSCHGQEKLLLSLCLGTEAEVFHCGLSVQNQMHL